MRILSGIQPSGLLHIGNYYGAIRQFVELQNEGEALYFIANLHALTTVKDGDLARKLTHETAVAFLALGLDPRRSIIFRQSDIPEVLELYWILGTVVPLANLERAHSLKDKLARGLSPDFGLFAYPVLMAADILLYRTDVVPVGRDQVQHLEFARDWATKFNSAFVPNYDPADPERKEAPGILRLPEARLHEDAAVVPGVDGQKMSKSYGNTIELFGPDAEVKKRIMSIKTDSVPVEAPKPPESALYQLLRLLAPKGDLAEIERSWKAGGVGYGTYKKKLVDYFHATFGEARRRHEELERDPGEVERILSDGARRARELAAPLMASVRRAVGLL
ncbi:MAG TPA: tryptophan--tRNA ligase [Anaeromyxobacteraceae bacterium]|nr:tryptophan--tRNA ligase [Anaeromyxobacteraceae bacterium]